MTARSRSSVKRKRESSEHPISPAPSASASVASARRTPTHALRQPSSIKDSTPKFSDLMPPPSSSSTPSSSHAQSVTKLSSNFQQGKGKSTTPLKSGNKPSPSPSPRKKARTTNTTTAVSKASSSSTKLGSNARGHPSGGPPGPSSDDEVIDLTEIKREGSPIRVNFTNGKTVIDLTLESDSD
ncbi:hypothetical protein NLI96_g4842 [Meripilus lineatus]|uniref:Uncharacterized protein n=1 Tax=Meripilus lineatus TaxID=2056292 RepID=A0AAD5YJP5_9APHY|nr:hypothetical protein NLI96_g4842 [Physisporinus lineatus]